MTHTHEYEQTALKTEARRYWIVLTIALTVLAIEITGGIFTGSLSLLSDALHVLVDSTQICVALIVVYFCKKNSEQEKLYRTRGAYVGLFFLVLTGGWIMFEAIGRFITPREVWGVVMFYVAFVGLIGNIGMLWVLRRAKTNTSTITHKIFDAHVLSDTLLSVAVCISAIAIWQKGWNIIDPILSCFVSIYILFHLTPDLYKTIQTGKAHSCGDEHKHEHDHH